MKFTYLFLSFLVVSLFFSCKKDEVQVDKYAKYPITLSGTGVFESANLTWTTLESKDFVQYEIYQSVNKDSIINNLGNAFLVAVFKDAQDNKINDLPFSNLGGGNADSIYYRVAAKLKDRTVLSNNILITNSNYLKYDGSLVNTFYDRATNTFLGIDQNKNRLIKINLLTKKIESAVLQNSAVDGIILTNTVNGVKEITVATSGNVYIYDFNALKLTRAIVPNSGLNSITTDEKGMLYFSSFSNMTIYNRVNNTQTTYSYANSNTSFPYFTFIPNTNKILVVDRFGATLSYINLSADHKTVVNESGLVTQSGSFKSIEAATTVVMDENNLLMPTFFSIKNKDFADLGVLPISAFNNGVESLVAKKNATDYYVQVDTNNGTKGFGADVFLMQLPSTLIKKKSFSGILINGIFPLDNDEFIIMYQKDFGTFNTPTKFEKLKF